MRNKYRSILKDFFHAQLIETRSALHFTQAEMACQLAMDSRSYVELEHGNNCCSALTLALFLIHCCENQEQFLLDLQMALEEEASYAL